MFSSHPCVVSVSLTTASFLMHLPNKSIAIRDAIAVELAHHPHLPQRSQLPMEGRVRLTVRLDPSTEQALAHYAQYGLRRAFVSRALERAFGG